MVDKQASETPLEPIEGEQPREEQLTPEMERRIREAEEAAFKRAQAKMDKDAERIRQQMEALQRTTQEQLQALDTRYRAALEEYGAGEEDVRKIQQQSEFEAQYAQMRQEALAYKQMQVQQEAQRRTEETIEAECRRWGVDRNDPRLDIASTRTHDEFMERLRRIVLEDRTAALKSVEETALERQRSSGALDVLGGGGEGALGGPTDWMAASPEEIEKMRRKVRREGRVRTK